MRKANKSKNKLPKNSTTRKNAKPKLEFDFVVSETPESSFEVDFSDDVEYLNVRSKKKRTTKPLKTKIVLNTSVSSDGSYEPKSAKVLDTSFSSDVSIIPKVKAIHVR